MCEHILGSKNVQAHILPSKSVYQNYSHIETEMKVVNFPQELSILTFDVSLLMHQ